MASGSFPLMQLAREYGVDYGDVLLMADCLSHDPRGDKPTVDRFMRHYWPARCRIAEALTVAQAATLEGRLTEHVDWRWRRRP
jgi:sugar phosphate isomerase/epimerase